jgi:colanic acid/amylovoran biosynthesis glycosyltransferase
VKIAFSTYDRAEDIGGVSSWLQRLLPRLQASGLTVEVHVLSFDGRPGVNCAAFERQGIPFRWQPWDGDTRKAVRRCLAMIQAGQPDVYVANSMPQTYYAAGIARRQGLATVGVLHSDHSFYRGVVEQFANGLADFRLSAVVAVSNFLEAETKVAVGDNLPILRCIGCGVPVAETSARPAEEVFRLVYIGRLEEEAKCISEVTLALCAAARQNPTVEAWLVGDGTERAKVEQIIQTSGVGARVKLLGRVELANVYPILSECQALVLLSDYEGLPVSVLEAMSAGVVPVCLDVRSGIREAIKPGVNGLIVRDRNEDFLAAIQTLHQDPELWAKLSANARTTIRERFSDDICTAAWVDLLRSLNGKSPARGIRIPFSLRLPPANHDLGGEDNRPTAWQRARYGFRHAGGYCKRKIFGPMLKPPFKRSLTTPSAD